MSLLFPVGVCRDENFKRKRNVKANKKPDIPKSHRNIGFFYAVCKDDFKIFAISFGFAMFLTVKLPFFAVTVMFP